MGVDGCNPPIISINSHAKKFSLFMGFCLRRIILCSSFIGRKFFFTVFLVKIGVHNMITHTPQNCISPWFWVILVKIRWFYELFRVVLVKIRWFSSFFEGPWWISLSEKHDISGGYFYDISRISAETIIRPKCLWLL